MRQIVTKIEMFDYVGLRRQDDDGRDALLPRELPEELVVDVERPLGGDVRVGNVEAVDEREQDRVLPRQGVHAEASQIS